MPQQRSSPTLPPQHQQTQPGRQWRMSPPPVSIRDEYIGARKLLGKVALISGGDSGIGRAVAIHFAREGASIALIYRDEHTDAQETVSLVEAEGGGAISFAGDCAEKAFCESVVEQTVAAYGGIDVLVNNAAEQHVQTDLLNISEEQARATFDSNFFGYLFLTQAALPHLGSGASIINTGSVTSFRGSPGLIDYSATKGAIHAYTQSLAKSLVERGIRVNCVAPGPIWTPLIPASFSAEKVAEFGSNTPMGRPGQPAEVAPAYVYFACSDSSYVTGQVIHVNGGDYFGG